MISTVLDSVAAAHTRGPTNGLMIAVFTAAVLVSFIGTFALGYRGLKRFEPETRRWLAGFFEQGTTQSSTRLVGILSFMAAVFLTFIVVVAVLVGSWLGVNELASPSAAMAALIGTLIGMLFANACVALGLRKPGEASGDAPPGPAATNAPTPPAQ